MKEKKELTIGKSLLGLYISRFQKEAFCQFNEPRIIDGFWPFKFVWFILVKLWQRLFGRLKTKVVKAGK
ncbi:hypothetical protein HZB07_07315 [Candidatus Saganbacteria bacterium]|nr:hypothetical protein [Candidatus Saganbacteria bacterium]